MPRWILLLALVCLSGCSLSNRVAQSSIDYNKALEDVTNNMLVTNILLARDQAPLHFTDLSQIRGTLQLQESLQSTFPFGERYLTSNTRNSLQATVTVNSNPTFDVVPLNTKNFTQGITSPIDFKFIFYYLDRRLWSNLLIRLAIEKLDIVEDFHGNQLECEITNHPNANWETREVTADILSCNGMIERVLRIPHAQSQGQYIFQDIVPLLRNIDYTSKVTERPGQTGKAPEKITTTTLCLEPDEKAKRPWLVVRLASFGDAIDRTPIVEAPADLCAPNGTAAHTKRPMQPQVILYVRSVEAIFEYLGLMLTFDEKDRELPFKLQTVPEDRTRFVVPYRGTDYYVDNPVGRCAPEVMGANPDPLLTEPDCQDETLAILAILNQLLNLYKNAADIPTTKAVQSVP